MKGNYPRAIVLSANADAERALGASKIHVLG